MTHVNNAMVGTIARLLLGTVLGATICLGVASVSAQAQVSERPDPLEDLQTKDGADFFNGRGNGSSGIMNFIQNAIIGLPKDAGQFAEEQRENLDEETARFRALQAEQFRKQQPSTTPTAPSLESIPSDTPKATPLN